MSIEKRSMTESTVWVLEWTDELSVGIPEVDEDHKRFIKLVNGLNQAILDRQGLAEIRKCMQLLLDDAEQHFAHEERLFKQWNYPDSDEHAEKHAQVTEELHAIKDEFNLKNTEYKWIAAGLKIKEALIEHLMNEDMKYRDYYRSMSH